jgi:hypothetical protein
VLAVDVPGMSVPHVGKDDTALKPDFCACMTHAHCFGSRCRGDEGERERRTGEGCCQHGVVRPGACRILLPVTTGQYEPSRCGLLVSIPNGVAVAVSASPR